MYTVELNLVFPEIDSDAKKIIEIIDAQGMSEKTLNFLSSNFENHPFLPIISGLYNFQNVYDILWKKRNLRIPSEDEIQEYLYKHGFQEMTLEVTEACNMRCKYLGNSKVNWYIEIVDKGGFKNLTERERKLLAGGKIQPTDIFRYSHNVDYNPCLGGTLSIAHDGQVYPCRMLRNHPVGNIRGQNLSEIIKGRLEKFWKLTKDNIVPCQDCSLKYTCYECRAVEESLTGDITSTFLCPRR